MIFWIVALIIIGVGSLPLLIAVGRGADGGEPYQKRVRRGILILSGAIMVLILGSVFLHFYGEYLWFKSLNYADRFWTVLATQWLLFLLGAVVAALFVIGNYAAVRSRTSAVPFRLSVYYALGVGVIFGLWSAAWWEEVLLYLNQVRSPVEDPVYGRSTAFYLFSLPLYKSFVPWLIGVIIAGLGPPAIAAASMNGTRGGTSFELPRRGGTIGHVSALAGLLVAVLAWNSYLSLYELLYGNRSAVIGAGYTDVHAMIPGYYVTIGLLTLSALALLAAAFSSTIRRRIFFMSGGRFTGGSIIPPAAVVAIIVTALWLVPAFVQTLIVSPNEITLERPYLDNNIEFTRRGYSIDERRVTEELFPIGETITPSVVDANRPTLNNVRLWDWRALMDNLRQQQEIRLYYRFYDVDIDRYMLDGEYRQVMLAVRELAQEDLDPRSKNWVSEHLKYTHGFGVVLLPAHDFLPQGKPELLIKNIPPVVNVESIRITQPRIYYGELTNNYVYVNTTEKEFDYPIGDEIVYNTYGGDGGVPMGSLWRRFVYAWKFNDYRLLLSGYFTKESKVMFRRRLHERARALMPFLLYDRDPYPVITGEGRIVYILDAYTTSDWWPYGQPYRGSIPHFQGLNYIRNSVKIVIDAYQGTVEPYIVDTSDVIISTYEKAFPDLFRGFDEMPSYLKEHIRYPTDYFTVQAQMYAAYHMVEPDAFYQREDLWEFATERYRAQFQTVSPYYVMNRFPGRDSIEFALIVPFTPKNKHVMNGWMAGRSDMPFYGKLTVFPFPKGVEVLGPRQIEARVDQNPVMSQAMTLWGQRGSEVLRGNLLVIPLFYGDSLHVTYVEPVFIQAEDAQLPEIKRIIVADQDRVVWAEDFSKALNLLSRREELAPEEIAEAAGEIDVQRATRLIEQFRALFGEGNYAEAGRRLEELERMLQGARE
ncbi:MAG: UPF0182 family protein [Chitinivibrionales bacterium]|nr:UPF0182 family protein [Chitinivibrionales bacterium]MBD3356887.1 UPF0182 family protein [Chitinivibrionales bacterium]